MRNVSVSSQKATSVLATLKGGLVVSCQVPHDTAIDTPDFIAAQALTVIQAGAIGIRAQGIANVTAISRVAHVPIIGLVKRYLNTTPIYITPTVPDVIELEQAGASIVAVDATERLRPDRLDFETFFKHLRLETNIPLLADVDSVEAAIIAEAVGCEAIATTLSGYTDKPAPPLPNIRLIEAIAKKVSVPLIAEGGFNQPNQVSQALDAGAWAVCIGTAITNPFLLTKSFIEGLG